jgi:transposase
MKHMDKLEQLETAYKKENSKVAVRMLAVLMILKDGKDLEHTAKTLHRCTNWVRKWVDRFKVDGLDGLYDHPRSGRPCAIPKKRIDSIMFKAMLTLFTPVMLQQTIFYSTGIKFHITHVRKIMHQYGMSAKTAQKYHINHASVTAVRSWQQRMKERISRLKKSGFTIAMLDEAFFIRDVKAGRKYWSPVAKRIFLPYTGRHESLAVYGTITINGNQLFRIYEKFNATTFVEYLKELHYKYGKIALILDRASVHKSKKVKKFLADNHDVKLIWLPKGSPYLNMIEQCWKISKHVLLVSEYYAMFVMLNKAVSEYFRITKFKLDVVNYIFRNPAKMFTNF